MRMQCFIEKALGFTSNIVGNHTSGISKESSFTFDFEVECRFFMSRGKRLSFCVHC